MSCSVCSQSRPGKDSREELGSRGKPQALEGAALSTVQFHCSCSAQALSPTRASLPGWPRPAAVLGGFFGVSGLWGCSRVWNCQPQVLLQSRAVLAPELSSECALPESPESCVHHRLSAAQGWDQGLGTGTWPDLAAWGRAGPFLKAV